MMHLVLCNVRPVGRKVMEDNGSQTSLGARETQDAGVNESLYRCLFQLVNSKPLTFQWTFTYYQPKIQAYKWNSERTLKRIYIVCCPPCRQYKLTMGTRHYWSSKHGFNIEISIRQVCGDNVCLKTQLMPPDPANDCFHNENPYFKKQLEGMLLLL